MGERTHTAGAVTAGRTALALALFGGFGGFTSFYLLLSVVPAYAARGGAGPTGSGLCTGALMLTTVVVQPLVPRSFAVMGRRRTLLAGGVLLGAPCLLLPLSAGLPALIALNLVRGLGFGVIVVTSVVAVAELVPPGRWGQRMGLYGAVIGLAGIVGSPAGLWTVHRFGYQPAFVLAAAATVPVFLAAGALRAAPAHAAPTAERHAGTGELVRLIAPAFLVEAVSTTAYGVIFTFLPLVVARDGAWLAPAALLVVQATSTAARWASGGLIDRFGGGRLLAPAILASAVGVAAGALPGNAAAVLAGMALFGVGFGVTQNASLVVVLRATRGAGTSVGSVAWNLAFDAGTGLGAIGGGLVLSAGGAAALFLSASALSALSLGAARTGPRRG